MNDDAIPEPAVIFLDIDGVLNRHERHPNGYCGILPDCVYRLNRIVAETGASLVISSAWRYMLSTAMSLDGFRYMLMTYGLDKDVHIQGRTAADEEIADRGNQIWSYLHRAGRPKRYVILDDGSHDPPVPPCTMTLSDSLATHGDHWVKVQPDEGLTDFHADRAIAILNGRPAEVPS